MRVFSSVPAAAFASSAAFGQRRKTLHNALKSFAPLGGKVPEAFARKRAEELSEEDFLVLTASCKPRPGGVA